MSLREAVLHEVESMPALPMIAIKAVPLLTNPNSDLVEIARIVSHDPALAANTLRFANSALLAGREPVTSVHDAIKRLGTQCVLSMMMGSAIAPLEQGEVPGYDIPPGDLWRHCVAVACCSDQLASHIDIENQPCAFTAGLLLDVGKIALARAAAVNVDDVLAHARNEQVPFDQAERDVLGIDHAEAGAHLLEHWGVPEPFISTVKFHHQPSMADEAAHPLVDLVHLADQICTSAGLGVGRDGLRYKVSESSADVLGLTTRIIEQTLGETVTRLDGIEAAMGA